MDNVPPRPVPVAVVEEAGHDRLGRLAGRHQPLLGDEPHRAIAHQGEDEQHEEGADHRDRQANPALPHIRQVAEVAAGTLEATELRDDQHEASAGGGEHRHKVSDCEDDNLPNVLQCKHEAIDEEAGRPSKPIGVRVDHLAGHGVHNAAHQLQGQHDAKVDRLHTEHKHREREPNRKTKLSSKFTTRHHHLPNGVDHGVTILVVQQLLRVLDGREGQDELLRDVVMWWWQRRRAKLSIQFALSIAGVTLLAAIGIAGVVVVVLFGGQNSIQSMLPGVVLADEVVMVGAAHQHDDGQGGQTYAVCIKEISVDRLAAKFEPRLTWPPFVECPASPLARLGGPCTCAPAP